MNPTTMKKLNIVLCLIDHPKCAGMTCTVNTYLIGFVKQKKVWLVNYLNGVISTSSKANCMDFNQLKGRNIFGIFHLRVRVVNATQKERNELSYFNCTQMQEDIPLTLSLALSLPVTSWINLQDKDTYLFSKDFSAFISSLNFYPLWVYPGDLKMEGTKSSLYKR